MRRILLYVLLAQSIVALQGPSERFEQLDVLMNRGVNTGVFPGGVLLVMHKGNIVYHKSFGRYT